VGGEVDVALAEMMARQWVTFRKHRPAGAYLPVGQLDGDCHECGNAWPCPAVELILSPWLARLEAAESARDEALAALEAGDACGAVGCRALAERDEALAAVERVRALADVWQASASRELGDPTDRVWLACAEQLLAALTPSAPTEEER
jgi:hypothetical protein